MARAWDHPGRCGMVRDYLAGGEMIAAAWWVRLLLWLMRAREWVLTWARKWL